VLVGRMELVTLPTSNHLSLLPYQIPQVRGLLNKLFPRTPPSIIVDGTCHIGSDSINFSNTFPSAKIIAIDIDPEAIRCLELNVQRLNKTDRFEIVTDDFETWMERTHTKADMYYLDPPWGDGYHVEEEIPLTLGGKSIEEIINRIFELDLTSKVLLKVPRNFAYPDFKKAVQKKTELSYIYKLGKHPQIAYGLVIIG
jgi:predicted RNA methylase